MFDEYVRSGNQLDSPSTASYLPPDPNVDAERLIAELKTAYLTQVSKNAAAGTLELVTVADADHALLEHRENVRLSALACIAAIIIGDSIKADYPSVAWHAEPTGALFLKLNSSEYFDIFSACSAKLSNDNPRKFSNVMAYLRERLTPTRG